MARTWFLAVALVSVLAVFGGDVSIAPGGGFASAFMLQSSLVSRHVPGTMASGACSGDARWRSNFRQHIRYGSSSVRVGLQRPTCHWIPLQQKETTLSSQLLLLRRRRPRASTTARSAARTAAGVTMSTDLSAGSVVVFEPEVKGRPPVLGLVMGNVGKKKSVYTVQPAALSASSIAVAQRQVRYVVPGGSDYRAADLAAFEDLEPVEDSLIAEAWEMLLEESTVAATAGEDGDETAGTIDPQSMAELLFGVVEPTPRECYHAFCLLEGRAGTMHFKRRRDASYECRSRCVSPIEAAEL